MTGQGADADFGERFGQWFGCFGVAPLLLVVPLVYVGGMIQAWNSGVIFGLMYTLTPLGPVLAALATGLLAIPWLVVAAVLATVVSAGEWLWRRVRR